MKYPNIRTPLPGPRASALLELDRTYVSPSYTRAYPLVAEKAEGLWLQDADGNIFLDFTAGIAVCATGHCHPQVVKAITEQAGRLLHMSGTDFYYAPQILLAQKLALLAPGDKGKKVFFGNSGAEAVEAAFKLARWHTKRELNLAFFGAFHGRTMGALLSLTASKTIQKKHYHPLVPGITLSLIPTATDVLTSSAILNVTSPAWKIPSFAPLFPRASRLCHRQCGHGAQGRAGDRRSPRKIITRTGRQQWRAVS